jgi:hypothetical protein
VALLRSPTPVGTQHSLVVYPRDGHTSTSVKTFHPSPKRPKPGYSAAEIGTVAELFLQVCNPITEGNHTVAGTLADTGG